MNGNLNLISKRYGGGNKIIRKVLEKAGNLYIELHPFKLKLGVFTQDNLEKKIGTQDQTFGVFEFSNKTTLKEVKEFARREFGLTEDLPIRLWASLFGSPYRLYKKEEEDSRLEEVITRPNGQQILVEVQRGIEWILDYKHKEVKFR
jgi:hypothetical protein